MRRKILIAIGLVLAVVGVVYIRLHTLSVTATKVNENLLNYKWLTLNKDDGFISVRSDLVGDKYVIQLRYKEKGILKTKNVINDKGVFFNFIIPDTDEFSLTVGRMATKESFVRLMTTKVNMSVDIEDEFKRYLVPNIYVEYNENSLSTKLAEKINEYIEYNQVEILKGLISPTDENIPDIIRKSLEKGYELNHKKFTSYSFKEAKAIEFDKEKVNIYKSQPVYMPNLDEILTIKKGICIDKAALMVAMLRSQGIPAKFVGGKYDGSGHAWVEVYIDGEWHSYDPTTGDTDLSDNYKVDFYY